jgi:hypothetical protein
MMPVVTSCSTLLKPAAEALAGKFGKSVIERWTRYRAERFFEAFVGALATEATSGVEASNTEQFLSCILEDEVRSEALYDAYRRVCFSKSKNLGPRIIGLLTAQLVNKGRMATTEEEAIFEGAELLSDMEFIDFMKDYHRYRTKAKNAPDVHTYMEEESVVVLLHEDLSDKTNVHRQQVEVGPLDLEESLGRWAVTLTQTGLLSQKTKQTLVYEEPSDYPRERKSQLSTGVASTVYFRPGCTRLYDLICRALGSSKEAK